MTETYEPSLLDPELMADPRTGFGELRAKADIWRGRAMDGTPAWYLMRAADVRAVLNDPRFVTGATIDLGSDDRRRALLGSLGVTGELAGYVINLMPDLDGTDHSRLRRLVSSAFTGRRVLELRPRVEEITRRLLDDVEARAAADGGPVDLIEHFAYPLPITVICELVGVPEQDRPMWREWGDALVTLDPDRFAGALRAMVDHTRALVEQRRAEPAEDLISSMLRAQANDGARLSDDELIKMVITLVNTGHETTAHLIGNSLIGLLNHPDQLKLLTEDPNRWPSAVHELVRAWTPVRVTGLRFATEDVTVSGQLIEAGEAVQPVLVSANFDEHEHPDGRDFDVTRRDGPGEGHVGFGAGIHYCLGASLARQETEVALSALFRRFPKLRMDGDAEWVPGPLLIRLTSLPVRLG
ncbi:cytochrome P450 family protein [Prauserella cavernicola]|uniref:Cytochrome P450 n=1 Tax=Prauserella cavernicola TaxID=2800127 RepID=A0A934QUJ3_9PSEU|nr:cytochrome P450 [Prauserella cavernicola]MBK1786588.1 cytochrome P450 [Prauserella cavernicola]